jgi:hypothetical protein
MKNRFWISATIAICVILPMQTLISTPSIASVQVAKDPTRNLSKEERKKFPLKFG